MPRQFDVVIERDSEGYYVASVPRMAGCHTHARSLDEFTERIREAIELCMEVEGAPELQFGVRWYPACDHRGMSRSPRHRARSHWRAWYIAASSTRNSWCSRGLTRSSRCVSRQQRSHSAKSTTISVGWDTFAPVCRMCMALGAPQPGTSATRVSSRPDVRLRPAGSLPGGYPRVAWQMIGWH